MSKTSRLPTDQYYIRNEDTFAGRNYVEDRSLNPKAIFCPTDGEPELWFIEALENGRYIIKARGAPTGVRHNHVYAFLMNEKPEEWVITEVPSEGHRALYVIETESKATAWVAQKSVDIPIVAVRALIINPSEPPQFPANGLWNIQPLVT